MHKAIIKVEAERSVAFKSPDYLYPYGTARDNHRNWRFNEKIYEVFKYKHSSVVTTKATPIIIQILYIQLFAYLKKIYLLQ